MMVRRNFNQHNIISTTTKKKLIMDIHNHFNVQRNLFINVRFHRVSLRYFLINNLNIDIVVYPLFRFYMIFI